MRVRRYAAEGRNRWLVRPEGDAWPLAFDLGRGIGSRRWWRAAAQLVAGLSLALALGLLPTTAPAPEQTASPPTAGPRAQSTAAVEEAASPPALEPDMRAAAVAGPVMRTVKLALAHGDTLIDTLRGAGIGAAEAQRAVAALAGLFDPRRLRIGQQVELVLRSDEATPRLARLAVRTQIDEEVVAEATPEGGYRAFRQALETTPLMAYASGTIDDSLYLAAERAGVPVPVIVSLIRLYSFSVDFQREIRPGDRFEILYERDVAADDGLHEDGPVLYARLELSGRSLPLYRFRIPDDGRVDYFNAAGASVRKALMKTPLDGARLTSRFGRRKHPILGYVRAHRGVDFGAPRGTPVYAAGDGVVERASRYGSYGNYIRIRHNGLYKTAYGHLSKYGRGIRAGVHVIQGQIIGYVGATGGATGPHLHYEVLRDGRQVNPLTLELPSGRVLKGAVRDAFLAARARIDADRDTLAHTIRLAHAAGRR